MPFGFKEVEGIHSRTNFDLSQHEKFSGKSIKYFDPQTNESYTPYVIETSIGVDPTMLPMVMPRLVQAIMPSRLLLNRWLRAIGPVCLPRRIPACLVSLMVMVPITPALYLR